MSQKNQPGPSKRQLLVDGQMRPAATLPELFIQTELVEADQERRQGDIRRGEDRAAEPGADSLVLRIREFRLNVV